MLLPYLKIRDGKKNFRYSIIVSEDPLKVNYFDLSVKGKCHTLNEKYAWDVYEKDLDEKISEPEINRGTFRTFYNFKNFNA